MSGEFDMGKFLDKNLGRISNAGEWLGKNLGGIGRTAEKIIIAIGILFIFGIGVFFWAVAQGLVKKKK